MAAQVLNGSGNISYTNSTGQNVRLVINYIEIIPSGVTFSISEALNITFGVNGGVYGKTLAYRANSSTGAVEGSMAWDVDQGQAIEAIPLEVALDNGDTFSVNGRDNSTNIKGYNIIIIPEAG